MNTRPLGRTGLQVSEIGFGGWAIGGNAFGNSYGPTDDAESQRAVRRAYDLGCTFFDTADVYGHGHSEEVLGAALQGLRDKVIVATKVGGNFYNRDIHPLMRDRVAQTVGRPLEEIETSRTTRTSRRPTCASRWSDRWRGYAPTTLTCCSCTTRRST